MKTYTASQNHANQKYCSPRSVAALRHSLLVVLLLLSAFAARSQNCAKELAPGCSDRPFKVVDNQTGVELTTLQVGCTVRFVQNCGRNTDPALLYYRVLKNTNGTAGTSPPSCLPGTTAGVLTYTPTAADVGPVTVFELSNSSANPGSGEAYFRNYTVVAPTPPTFTVAACAGSSALVTLINPVYDQYSVQVNGGAAQPIANGQSLSVAITPGAANTFVVTGNPASSCPQLSPAQTSTLPVAQTPVLTRLTRTGSAATGGPAVFEFSQVPAGFSYTLLVANPGQPGAYQTVATVPVATGSTATFTLDPAPAGRYLLGRTDACTPAPAYFVSNQVVTLGLSGTATNNLNRLTFSPFGLVAIASYTLTRNDGVVVTLPGSATGYDDTRVMCGNTYTYRLAATLTLGGGQSVSNTVALMAQSTTLPPTPVVVPSFDLRNGVVVTVLPGAGAAFAVGSQVTLSRQAGGAAPVAYLPLHTGKAGVASRSLRDSTALATLFALPPCYSATVRDTCGNVSVVSAASCPVLLTAAAADPEGQTAQLRWSAFRGPGSPTVATTYRVLTLAADGTVLAASAPTTALSYLDPTPPTDRQILRYRVEASGAGLPTGTVSYSNVGSLTRRPRLVVPTAFTPNGDGLNDVLELKGRYLQDFTFIVVDRNGQEVFRATDRTQTWDGTINGHAPVNSAYVWRLDLRDEEGQPLRQTGTVTILK